VTAPRYPEFNVMLFPSATAGFALRREVKYDTCQF
jgi:hypothetical protein